MSLRKCLVLLFTIVLFSLEVQSGANIYPSPFLFSTIEESSIVMSSSSYHF